jgi:hypothetical protein
MVTGVDQAATAHGLRGGPPTPLRERLGVAEAVAGACEEDLAQRTVFQHLARFLYRGIEQLVVRAHHGDAAPAHRRGDVLGLTERQAQRLLADDVLAGPSAGDDRVPVQVMGQADVHRLNVRIGEEPGVVGVHRGPAYPAFHRLGARFDHVGDGGDHRLVSEGQPAVRVRPGDVAAANQPHF